MNRRILLGYQIAIAAADLLTGIGLIAVPALVLSLLGLHPSGAALPYLSFAGAFVTSVGIACAYGAHLIFRGGCPKRIETVWLLTAITRGMVALFLVTRILAGSMEAGWLAVALFDGACAAIQTMGLRQEWLLHVSR
jgi:hypothetical membrane protein